MAGSVHKNQAIGFRFKAFSMGLTGSHLAHHGTCRRPRGQAVAGIPKDPGEHFNYKALVLRDGLDAIAA